MDGWGFLSDGNDKRQIIGVIPLPLFSKKTRILFVCTENICRSPLAEGLLRHYLKLAGASGAIRVDSAGTHASQPGARPDQRASRIASDAGIGLDRIRARRVSEKDLIQSDLIIAMDRLHMSELRAICPPGHEHKISLLLSHDPDQFLEEVPDPYYGSYEGFVEVFQLIERAVVSLVTQIGKLANRRASVST